MKTINSKKNKKPKLLVQVLQAVQDLRRTHGSTLKRIADQVQMAVKCSKIKPPPRNVFGQVRRALKYGIKAGILKHRSGKFRLATKTEINYALQRGNKHNRRRQKKAKRKRKTKRKSRIRKPLYVAPLSPDTVNQMNNYSNVADQEQAVPETDSSYNHVVNAATKRRRKTKTTTKRRKRKTTGDRSSRRRRKRKQKQDEFCMAHNFDDIDERNCFGKDKGT